MLISSSFLHWSNLLGSRLNEAIVYRTFVAWGIKVSFLSMPLFGADKEHKRKTRGRLPQAKQPPGDVGVPFPKTLGFLLASLQLPKGGQTLRFPYARFGQCASVFRAKRSHLYLEM